MRGCRSRRGGDHGNRARIPLFAVRALAVELAGPSARCGQRDRVPARSQPDWATAYVFGSSTPIHTYEDALAADGDAYRRFVERLAAAGVYALARGMLYVSSAPRPAELERVRAATMQAASALRKDPTS